MQMLPRPQPHSQHILLGHLINQLLTNIRSIPLLLLRLRRHIPIRKLPHRPLQPPMTFLVVGALELRPQPERLGIGNGAQAARLGRDNLGSLALDGANAELVAVLVDDLLSVEIVEVGCRVLAGDLGEDDAAAWVGVQEVSQVIDAVVDDAPEGVLGVVLRDLGAGEGLGHGEGGGFMED